MIQTWERLSAKAT